MTIVLMITYPVIFAMSGLFLLLYVGQRLKDKQMIKLNQESSDFTHIYHIDTMQARDDKLNSFGTNHKFSMNREIIRVDDEPRLNITLVFEYQIKDEQLFSETHADQFMRHTIIEVTQKFITNFGTKSISDQKIALETRIKGALQAKTMDWGIDVISLNILKVQSFPQA
jgi:regulator of protease activity HflC (stomatin/prohibitin superfamily)